ncbi:MAG: hypothetical protein WC683_14550 [bacterium]
MKWSLSEFKALPPDERMDWLAYEYQRQKSIGDLINRAYEQGESGKVDATVVSAYALLALLRYG